VGNRPELPKSCQTPLLTNSQFANQLQQERGLDAGEANAIVIEVIGAEFEVVCPRTTSPLSSSGYRRYWGSNPKDWSDQ